MRSRLLPIISVILLAVGVYALSQRVPAPRATKPAIVSPVSAGTEFAPASPRPLSRLTEPAASVSAPVASRATSPAAASAFHSAAATDSRPPAVPASPAKIARARLVATDVAPRQPAIFGLQDVLDDLPAPQRDQIETLTDKFLADLGDADPAQPEEYNKRWRLAVSESDRLFKLYFGSFAYVQFNRDSAR